MTENHKENTSKTVDNVHMAAHAVHDDVKTSTHTMHKDADVKSQVASGHEKTGIHTPLSADPKFKDHNMHKDADVKSQAASGHEKTDSHTPVSESAQGTDSAKKQIFTQISAVLAGAKFPVKTQAELVSAFPDGSVTTYGTHKLTAHDARNLLRPTDFPFINAKAVAAIIAQRASL
jgi:hypothetical protein